MGLKATVKSHPKESVRAFTVCICFLFFGAATVIPGNSLLDLQIRIQESLERTSKIITSNSIGYLLGTILMGVLDKYVDHYIAMAVSHFLGGFLMIVMPMMKGFYWMAMCSFLKGVFMAIIDLVGHLIIFNLWKRKSAALIQALRTFFSLGAFVGPIMVRPFMLPLVNPEQPNSTEEVTITVTKYLPDEVKVFWAYLPVGAAMIITGVPFIIFYFRDASESKDKSFEASTDTKKGEEKFTVLQQYLAVSIVACMFGISFSVGSLISNLTQAYGVKSALRMTKRSAALLVSLFWIGAILARAASIFLAAYIKPVKIQIAVVIMCSTSAIMFIGFAKTNETLFWISMLVFGVGRSPIFGLALSTLNKYFVPSGRQTSFMFMSGVISEALWVGIVGQYMEETPYIFCHFVGFFMVSQIILVTLLPFACKRIFRTQKEEHSKAPLSVEVFTGVDMETLERKSSIISISRG